MGQPCDLAPPGLLQFGGDPSPAEQVYASLVASVTSPKTGKSPFNLTPGSWFEARMFARAISLGSVLAHAQGALSQRDPNRATYGLPNLEADCLVTPQPSDTIQARQARVAAKKAGSRGAARWNVLQVLQGLLGANFYELLTRVSPVVVTPSSPGTSPHINAVLPTAPLKQVVLLDPVAPVTAATPRWVAYQNLLTQDPEVDLQAGDVLMVQPDNSDVGEKVTVIASKGTGASRQFQALFSNAHDPGCIATTGRWIPQQCNARFQFIVELTAAVTNPPTRAAVDAAMPDIVRAGTQWAQVDKLALGTVWTLGAAGTGTPLGAYALD